MEASKEMSLQLPKFAIFYFFRADSSVVEDQTESKQLEFNGLTAWGEVSGAGTVLLKYFFC